MLATELRARHLRALAQTFDDNWDRLREHPPEAREPGEVDCTAILDEFDQIVVECELADDDDRLVRHVHEKLAPKVERYRSATGIDAIGLLLEGLPRPGNAGAKGKWPVDYPLGDLRARVRGLDELCEELLADVQDQILRQLAAAIGRFCLDAAEDRRRQGVLEFHDLLVLARELLRDSPAPRAALHDRYTHLLLDEFQDTDPIQIELAVLVAASVAAGGSAAAHWEDVPTEPGSLFFVGDPKQSIYRFRRADIELFLRARDCFAPEGPVGLVENFRTVPGIVDFVNALFGRLIGEGVSGSQPRYDPLHAHREPIDDAVPVTLLGGPHDGARADELRRFEAVDVADTVVRVLDEGWPVCRDDGTVEPARPSDVAILIPARTSLGVLEEELQRREVPYRTETGSLVWNTQEVRDLLDVLRAVDDPTDALSVVAALRSPAFGCGDDDLFTWYEATRRWDYRVPPPDGLDAEHPVVDAMAWLNRLHRQRWWLGASELVATVARERRLFEFGVLERRPRDVWRRLRFVIDRARAFVEAEGGDLRAFLAWAELQASDVARPAERVLPEPDDESVRILTIHGSKGREFPVTVLSGLTTKKNNAQRRPQVLWRDEAPPEISLTKSVTTDHFAPAREAEEQMDVHEKLRLLYVGATRARDHLVVSAHHKTSDESFAGLVWSEAQAFAELWVGALDADPDDPRVHRVVDEPVDDGAGIDRASWITARSTVLGAQRAPRAVSATELARQVDGEALPVADEDRERGGLPRPATRGRAGTAIGRAVHAVLQHVDLATGEGLAELARAEAAAEGVASLADEVGARARRALDAPIVRQAVESGSFWRELYVAAPITADTDASWDAVVVEGYVDLLVRTPEGLVVVDYKTDGVASDAEADEALDRYRLQGAAYALALGRALGEDVVGCVFLFLSEHRALERRVVDLPGAVAEVARRAVAPPPGS
jgi:ATP-dependent exoDNAse (exonuclease V) beta subunit